MLWKDLPLSHFVTALPEGEPRVRESHSGGRGVTRKRDGEVSEGASPYRRGGSALAESERFGGLPLHIAGSA